MDSSSKSLVTRRSYLVTRKGELAQLGERLPCT